MQKLNSKSNQNIETHKYGTPQPKSKAKAIHTPEARSNSKPWARLSQNKKEIANLKLTQ